MPMYFPPRWTCAGHVHSIRLPGHSGRNERDPIRGPALGERARHEHSSCARQTLVDIIHGHGLGGNREIERKQNFMQRFRMGIGQGQRAGGNWKGMGIRGDEVFGKQCPCLYKDGFACWGRPPIPVNSPLPGAGCAFGSRTLGASLQHRWSPACPSILAHLVSKKPPTSMKISDCPKIQTPLFHLLPVSGTISTRRRDQWRRAAIRN